MLFDTHLHLDLFAEPKEIIKAIENQKSYSIAVTNLPQVFINTKEICGDSKYVRPALGYHPELVYKFNNQFELFLALLDETRYVGEIGVDNLRKTVDDFNFQKIIFKKIINACAEKKDKILTVHSRRAESEVISIIGNDFPGKIILHWYSGSISNLKKALSNGYYFSVNQAMINSKNGLNIIKNIPSERILLESDSPFIGVDKLSKVPMKDDILIHELSIVKKCPVESMKNKLIYNFKNILQKRDHGQ